MMPPSPEALEGEKLLNYLYFDLQIPSPRAIFLFREYVGRRKRRCQDAIIEAALKGGAHAG